MNHNMSTQFVHSVKVPRLYKESSKSVKKVLEEGASFKSIIFKQNHPNVQGIYALVAETLQHSKELEFLIDNTNILVENPCFDPWLARVLITELLWGKKVLKSDAKPVVTVLNYKDKLQQALLQNPNAAVDPYDKKRVKLPRYVRINTLLTNVDEALNAFYDDGWHLVPRCDSYSSHLEAILNLSGDYFIQDFHIPEVFVFSPGTKFHDHPGYLKGKLLLQDKASCLPAFLLNPKPGSEILDMCSAPGMKTTHVAAVINNVGKVYAVEMNGNRYQTLLEFIKQTNSSCVEAIQADALTIAPEQYPNVKYILVDPSCSGSGMIDRIEIRNQDQEDLYDRLRKLQSLQSMILGHALSNFPKAKRVIYSTCSLYPEENECVVDEALAKFDDTFKLVDLRKKMKGQWNNFGSTEYSFNGGKCMYALPQKDFCNGFFLAMFKRKKKAQSPENADETEEAANSENSEVQPEKEPGGSCMEASVEAQGTKEEVNSSCSVKRKKSKKEKAESQAASVEKEENDDGRFKKEKKKKKGKREVDASEE